MSQIDSIGSKIWCDVRMLNCNSEICKKLISNFFNIEPYKIDNLSMKARGVTGISGRKKYWIWI